MNPFKSAKIIGDNIDPAVYTRQDAKRGDKDYIMSRSELMEFSQCPHRWISGYREDSETKSTEWGNLIDCLVLQPDAFARRFAVTPAMYPCEPTKRDPRTEKPWNRNANHCSDWEADAEKNGFTVIKAERRADADTAVKALMADEHLAELISCSRKQVFVMAEYHDRETGLIIPVKALLDLVPDPAHPRFGRTLADFKTSHTADPARWPSICYNSNYDAQGALHMDAYVKATGEDRTDWIHAIQENFPPYETGRCLLSAEFVDRGRMKYVQALKSYARCLATNEWPGYCDGLGQIMDGFPLVKPLPWMMTMENVWREPARIKPEEDNEFVGSN